MTSPFTLYLPAIILCAWLGGIWLGLFTAVVSALIGVYFFVVPYYSFKFANPKALAPLVIFLLVGALISSLGESLHRSRRAAEAKAIKEREERERFRVTLDSIGDAVIATDPAGRVTFMNPAAEFLTGWSQEEAAERTLSEVFPIVDEVTREALESPHARLMREGTAATLSKHALLITKNKTELRIEDSGAPIRAASGEIVGGVLVFRDISESQRIKREGAQLSAIVTSSEDAIISKSLSGVIESWNSAAERMFGYTAAEAIGQSITMIIPPERLDEERQILGRINAGQRVDHFETVRVRKDGRRLDISLTVSPIRDAYGRIVGASKTARDITQRKRDEADARLLVGERVAREQAEAASRAKDEFVATVSHEIRTPLNAILGWAQLLQMGKLDSIQSAQALDCIERSARSQAQLIDDLLDISRVITGKLRLDVQTIDPMQIIQTTLDSIRPAADARAIRLKVILASEGNLISADPARLQQIFWNLLSNAVKFTPKQGLIEVRLDSIGSLVRLVVKDSGAGINPEFLPFVFERFSQASAGSVRKHGGLGLGLAIVRHLVELHGGTVQAESPGEGQGAIFTVTFPITARSARALEAASEDAEASERTIRLDGLHILIVDDEAEMKDLLTILLTQYGAQVTARASGAEVLDAIDELQPSLLISDIGMPYEDGYSLMRKIRRRGRTIPAIALTGFPRSEDRTRALAAGFQMVVSKPVESNELLTVIASLTGRLPLQRLAA
jgi:PAS domain S-box-containing protein